MRVFPFEDDQDGRLTKAIFDRLSLAVKSKVLLTTAGNHDLWVCGGPSCGDEYDQAGYGFAQYYGQDVVGSGRTAGGSARPDFLSFGVDPDEGKAFKTFQNNYTNFAQYHTVGNLGFIGKNHPFPLSLSALN